MILQREFVITHEFDKKWTSLGLTDDDLRELQNFLLAFPDYGDIMQGTGGIKKLRWALPNKGKSGSIRVIYLDILAAEKIYLLTAYPKNEKANLSKAERNQLAQLSALLKATETRSRSQKGECMAHTMFESIKRGLEQAVAYESGKNTARKSVVRIEPIPQYRGKEIRDIRTDLNLTQGNFAVVLGVSPKTVEAWECGRNTPQGTAQRFLQVLKTGGTDFLKQYKILGA